VSAAERFVALVGFPRSGTTVLTALLDAHSEVTMYYEPWNASPKRRPTAPESLASFLSSMGARFGAPERETRYVGFKETVTYGESRDFAMETIDNVARETPTDVLWIFRDPVHCFFSKLDGARKWWGEPEAEFSESGLVRYLRECGPHLAALLDVTKRHRGTIVGYEALVSRPEETLGALMKALDLEREASQLDYYKAGPHPDKVMGDPNVALRPRPLSRTSITRRRREVERHRTVIEAALSAGEFDWLRAQCEWLAALPGIASADQSG